MAIAAFKLVKCTGADAATETDCSKHPTFLSSDTHTETASTYPIVIPQTSGSTHYSYETWLRVECTTAPDNYVQNVKFFGPNSQPDAENKLAVYAGTAISGSAPINSESSTATTSQHDNYYSAGTALDIPISAAGQAGKIDSVGEQADFIVLQLRVAYGATAGNMETQTYNIQYEET